MTSSAPKGLRLHIAFFGRRNVGKSSLLNALTRQQVSIVSPLAGTTTDPVEKPMELLPLGPVLFLDTAGLDDTGEVGALRVQKTRAVLERTEVAVLVAEAANGVDLKTNFCANSARASCPRSSSSTKSDAAPASAGVLEKLKAQKLRVVQTSAVTGAGLPDLRQALLAAAPPDFIDSPGESWATSWARANWPCWWCPLTKKRRKAG